MIGIIKFAMRLPVFLAVSPIALLIGASAWGLADSDEEQPIVYLWGWATAPLRGPAPEGTLSPHFRAQARAEQAEAALVELRAAVLGIQYWKGSGTGDVGSGAANVMMPDRPWLAVVALARAGMPEVAPSDLGGATPLDDPTA